MHSPLISWFAFSLHFRLVRLLLYPNPAIAYTPNNIQPDGPTGVSSTIMIQIGIFQMLE